ncbi:uncharacterized protein F5891DRAFT_1184371 [Suillus fuscotomentosus]|uniref:Uncharacterized protein n=1 Tax=Suillus fuscotomentosus TaxID=1912939 RepID=A0AAD4EDU6_9AGAM|nr:uncharacterized protein F5891DRAFT_1184371 [Suillus fuscotomentosus]KAG1904187.1 hypothetical protein F5891DRAFT_1184371 [Suillus fuscotomentosus]
MAHGQEELQELQVFYQAISTASDCLIRVSDSGEPAESQPHVSYTGIGGTLECLYAQSMETYITFGYNPTAHPLPLEGTSDGQADCHRIAEHFDTSHYGLGLTKFLKIHEGMGLRRTRQQMHTVETICEAMTDLRQTYPNAGAREMVSLLFHEQNMSVARSVVTSYFAIYEPELVLQCKANRLRRRRFWAAGVNDIFTVDQHDKWLRYGLGLHTGIEPFSGRIMWMRVWHSNWNPQLILSYYLDTLDMLGHMPMVTQSDPGSENFGIANAHTMLRQWHDPALQGTLQHRWMQNKKNRELDAYQDRVNNTQKRRDRNKILPHGMPNIVYQSPEDFGALDFKITVEREALDHCCYEELGCPSVTRQSAWDVYLLLLDMLQGNEEIPSAIEDVEEDLPLLENHQDLPYREENNGTYYMGGVGGGLGLGDKDLYQLDNLIRDDEPDTAGSIDEDIVGLDHDGLVVWEFSYFSDVSDGDTDVPVDEW